MPKRSVFGTCVEWPLCADSAISILLSNETAGGEMGIIKRVFAVCAVVGGLVMAALLLPVKIVDFEKNLPEAYEYVTSIIYSSEAWTGTFDKYPEGLADMASLGISSNVDAALEIEVVEGNRLDGRVWWQGSCAVGSPYSGLLLDGQIRLGGSSAEVGSGPIKYIADIEVR